MASGEKQLRVVESSEGQVEYLGPEYFQRQRTLQALGTLPTQLACTPKTYVADVLRPDDN